jgi:hypothetical protein
VAGTRSAVDAIPRRYDIMKSDTLVPSVISEPALEFFKTLGLALLLSPLEKIGVSVGLAGIVQLMVGILEAVLFMLWLYKYRTTLLSLINR